MISKPPTSHNIEAAIEQAKHLARLKIAQRAQSDLYYLCREVLGYKAMTPGTHGELCATTQGLLPDNKWANASTTKDIDWLSIGIKEDYVAHYTMDDVDDSTPHRHPIEPLVARSSYLNPLTTVPTKISAENQFGSVKPLVPENTGLDTKASGLYKQTVDNVNTDGKIEESDSPSASAASISKSSISITNQLYRDETGLHFYNNESNIPYDPEKKALHIEMPRGTFKSSVVTIGFTLQCILNDPDWRILIDSETYSKSKNFLAEIKNHLESNKKFREVYFTIYGAYPDSDRKNPSVRWKDNEIDLSCRTRGTKEASFTVSGVDKSINGMHFDLIVGDDLHSETNVTNSEQIEKVIQHYKLMLALLDPGRFLIIIGTRWHYFDMYQHLFDKEEFRFNFYVRKSINNDGTYLFPERLTKQYLADQRRTLGSYLYSCQYMNTPVDDEDATFKQSYMITRKWELVENIPINWYMSVDPSSEGTKGQSDYAAIIVAGLDALANLYVRHVTRRKMKYDELINQIFNVYLEYKPKEIVIETIASANSIQYMLSQEQKRRGIFLPIKYISGRNTNKEVRIEALQPYYAYGRAIHVLECPQRSDLEDELIAFPKGQNDDAIDSLATILEVARPARPTRDPEEAQKRKEKISRYTKPRSPMTKV